MTDTKKEEKDFNIASLSDTERKDFEFVQKRILQLQQSRRLHYGQDLDVLFADADRDYVPHRLKTKGKRVVAVDEDKGWRGQLVTLGSSDWQSDVSQGNVFIKIQTALSILIDQNPSGVFTATNKKYQATTELIKQLYQRSWEYAKSKQQLKLFIFNLAKYGWACARTYPLKLERMTSVPEGMNPDGTIKYGKPQKRIEYNDIMRENLDPRNVWIDDMARPNDQFSLRDWAWRKVYPLESAAVLFEKYPRWKYVKKGGNILETIVNFAPNRNQGPYKQYQDQNLVEIIFYENIEKDIFMMIANGVPVINEPLPIADIKGNKKLSLWQTYWNVRHSESCYGIGVYESIRYDQAIIDRIRNMTIDQLTLSIYKMFFYQGTQSLMETGDILIAPGVGKQTLDPKNINFLQVPGPGVESWKGIEVFKKDLDESSGITDPLSGEVTGKTAFELAQAKESALKRLKTPLDNVLDALNNEGYITISLIQLLYSIPETFEIADKTLIEDYLKEIQGDPALFERIPELDEEGNQIIDEQGGPKSTFNAKVYPEFPLNLEKDEKGNLFQTDDTKFFRIKPEGLEWEGIINIKAQSILSPSKQVDKALELEMYNMLIPLLAQPAQIYDKVAKNIVKLYDKDPRDILPDIWLNPQQPEQQQQENQSLFVPANQVQQNEPQGQPQGQAPQAPTLIPSTQPPTNPTSVASKIISRIKQPFTR